MISFIAKSSLSCNNRQSSNHLQRATTRCIPPVYLCCEIQAYLSYELDDLDKDVEGSVPGHHTPGAFGEKC